MYEKYLLSSQQMYCQHLFIIHSAQIKLQPACFHSHISYDSSYVFISVHVSCQNSVLHSEYSEDRLHN